MIQALRGNPNSHYRLWQTPVADDAVDRQKGKVNSRGEPKLSAQVKLWPTPTVCGNHNRKGASPDSGDGLATAVRNYPTPTTSMQTSADMEQARHAGNSENRPTYQEAKSRFPTPNSRDYKGMPSKGCRERSGRQSSLPVTIGGSLNPDWTEWLMGFPLGWTSLDPLPLIEWPSWANEPPGVPRTATRVPNRAARIKALGNAQVPQCAAAAFRILSE